MQIRSPLQPGICVVIPCLNEALTLERAVDQAKAAIKKAGLPGEVIVADNGSTDGSIELALKAGARIVPVRARGYGSALHHGIMSSQYEWVAFADADLSYPFIELDKLIAPLVANTADFVLGSRLNGNIDKGAMPFLNRYLGTPVLSFLIRLFYQLPVSDCNSGFRTIRKQSYSELQLRCPGMEYASEMLIRVAQHGLRYAEVPISFHKDQRNRPPHLNRWRDGWRHLRFILGNTSERWLIYTPAALGLVLLLFALVLSFGGSGEVHNGVRYHSALISIALSLPPLLIALSSLLIQAILHFSKQSTNRLTSFMVSLTDKNLIILTSLLFFGLMGIQSLLLFSHWAQIGYGPLDKIGPVIRIIISAILGSFLFMLDMGLGILNLIPYAIHEDRKD